MPRPSPFDYHRGLDWQYREPAARGTTCVRQFQRTAVTARGERRAFGRNGGFRPSTRGIPPHEAVSRTTSLLGSWTPLDGGTRPFLGSGPPHAPASEARVPAFTSAWGNRRAGHGYNQDEILFFHRPRVPQDHPRARTRGTARPWRASFRVLRPDGTACGPSGCPGKPGLRACVTRRTDGAVQGRPSTSLIAYWMNKVWNRLAAASQVRMPPARRAVGELPPIDTGTARKVGSGPPPGTVRNKIGASRI